MSHLTTSPFHKPSPFEFPQRAGDIEGLPANHHGHPQLPTPATTTSILGGHDPHAAEYFETPTPSISADPVGSRFRKAASSIVYHNSGLRESRDRTVQRSSRSFVVVLPPPSLPQDHGHLGHTLSSGPRHRLSQGLLMPLFPTMYGQLTAIAREYNFPSTTGVCLYLHYTDQGITVTPRISDDSWQMIWSHALDPVPGAAHTGLPISGKIEFDIDMRLARWYGAWMASSHREHVDVPMSVTPSAAPSVVHYREDSRSTIADGEDQDHPSVARPPVRHVPRKLSLIDRFDTMSARSVPRSIVARPSRPSPPELHPSVKNLPPISQEDEPKTAKVDLEQRVNTWRASASIISGGMVAEAAHIVLAGAANLPNSPLDESPVMQTSSGEQESEYREEDYEFSVTSFGPNDYDPYSPLDWYYDPSVHLANRVEGSVCMTPSTCTSFGPSDYTLPPHLLMPDADFGVRTPDIAHRMFEDVPPSPSDATSWGAPESFPPSPTSEHRALSVHLADRHEFSRPVTPMTATSWGAPESFPPSPTTPFYVHTPDAGQRSFDLDALSEHPAPWSLVWPYHDTSNSDRPWNMVWPYNADEAAVPQDTAAPEPWNMVWPYHANHAAPQEMTAPWNMVWPYHANHDVAQRPVVQAASGVALAAAGVAAAAGIALAAAGIAQAPAGQRRVSPTPWNMVWPYHAAEPSSSSGQLSVVSPVAYPHLNIYPAVYPHFDLYPAPSGTFTNTDSTATQSASGPVTIIPSGYPFFNLYPVYPANLLDLYSGVERAPSGISIRLAPRYAHFDLYPAVYPHVVPYPPFQGEMEAVQASSSHYPHFNLYPPVTTSSSTHRRAVVETGPVSVVLRTAYPVFNLYPAIYPIFDIYPGMEAGAHSLDRSVSIQLATAYPIINLYLAVYPVFDLYPALPEDRWAKAPAGYRVRVLSTGYPDFDIYPDVSRTRQRKVRSEARAVSEAPAAGYPDFNIYPAVSQARQSSKSDVLLQATALSAAAALAVGYSAVSQTSQRARTAVRSETRALSAGYPDFNIYPAVSQRSRTQAEARTLSAGYPDFDIYPAVSRSSRGPISVRVASSYPMLNIYPPVYPVLEIYPERPEDCTPASRGGAAVKSVVWYPTFVLYPPVIPAAYPNFEIYYPALPDDVLARSTSQQRSGISVRLPAAYPIFDLYPAVYPVLEIYPSLPDDRDARSQPARGISVRMALYPVFDLYPGAYLPPLPEDCGEQTAGYPHFNLYPAGGRAVAMQNNNSGTISLPVNYPNFNLYPAVYPYFDLYPEVVKAVDTRGVDVSAVTRYPYFNLYPAVYPHFELFPALLSLQEPRVRKMSRFTRSDLHALVQKAGLTPQPSVRKPSKSHQDLHMAVLLEGVISTPSGRVPRKTHFDLHLAVFPSGEVSTPSGTILKAAPVPAPTRAPAPAPSPVPEVRPPPVTAPRTITRVRSGSVLRQSLPPSPKPVGGRPVSVVRPPVLPEEPTVPIPSTLPPSSKPLGGRVVSVRPAVLPEEPTIPIPSTLPPSPKPVGGRSRPALSEEPTIPLPPAPANPLRRTLSSAIRPSVGIDRVTPKVASLGRSVSMKTPQSSAPEPIDRTSSVNGPRKRDSMVLQRVRALQMNSEPSIKEDDPLSSFPLPPRGSVFPPRKVVS